MKVGIVGAGAVAAACAFALVMRGKTRQLVLIDRVRERAKAAATDMRYGAPLAGRRAAVIGSSRAFSAAR